ncbi:hypothetical protein C8F04DRAFT_1092504 [Mycena alexandri]|uniref:F-box domain-containing protein n=1 Tax=Mycena alexandri TaxID=1745969 RepID=A0AAD6X766_9AGAR|nr:hypothetical protein C8F04DRAFT_1092504 [Mycena alexandri]
MISPFASKLGTNYCPSDEEVLEIQRLLVQPLSRLKGIDDKISELQKAIDELAEERDSVSTYVEAHEALLSPLRRLPLDIIQEMFIACLPTHRNCVMSAVEAPVLLGRICSLWRTVSLSTPRLWARLHIAEPKQPGQTPTYEAQYAQQVANTIAWLGRSGICPLSISLEGSQYPPSSAAGSVSPFVEVIVSHASRWQHIAITASSLALDTVFSLTDNDVPLLETLEIEQIHGRPSLQNVSLRLLRGPKISSLALATSDISLLALPLRWENLTSLRLANQRAGPLLPPLTSEAALQILSKCLRLRTCQLRLADRLLAPALEESILELPHLNSLNITCIGPTIFGPGRFFSRVLLPELRSLRISCGSHTRHNPFFPFLTVSPRLECLQLELNLLSPLVVLDLLSMLPPTIRRLRFSLPTSRAHRIQPGVSIVRSIVRPSPFEDSALEALTPSPDHPAVSCPILQELEIDPTVDLSDQALLRFIKARMAVQSPTLQRVAIQFQRQKEFDIRPEIQLFLNSGLEVSTRYFEPSVSGFSPWRGVKDPPH